MSRLILILLSAALAAVPLWPVAAFPLDDQAALDTGAFLAELQHPDGGFRNSGTSGPLEIIPTALAVRAMGVVEEEMPHKRHLGLFVLSCWDPITGGFSAVANQDPEYEPSAYGLMAMKWANSGGMERMRKTSEYLSMHAKTIKEIYLAALAHEAAGFAPPRAEEWKKALQAARKPGGMYGETPIETAQAVTALRILNETIPEPAEVLAYLKSAARPDGGYGRDASHGNMEETYPVARALHYLGGPAELGPILKFVSLCREELGGYGAFPRQEPAAIPTGLAVAILALSEQPAEAKK